MSRTLPAGIRKTRTGYQAYVWRQDPTKAHGGYQTSKRYGPDATIAEMKAWREEQRLRGTHPELFAETDPAATTFADDARDYLNRPSVQRMPTYRERVKHIEEWIAIFGRRARPSIEYREIQQQLDALGSTYEPSSVNKRRTALMHLWTVLDGRHAANPVKATTKAAEATPEPRAPALLTVVRLLKHYPAQTEYGLKCRARCKVIAWTGWPHALIKQLVPADREHWRHGRAFVRRRAKGKGARARWLPLLPHAVAALEEFHRADAYGPFSNSSLLIRTKKACVALGLPQIRVYDLRHFFGTLVATLTQDERALMELMLVSTPAVIRRYTEAATQPRVQAAVAAVVKQLPGLLAAVGRIGRVSRVRRGAKRPHRDIRRRQNKGKSSKAA